MKKEIQKAGVILKNQMKALCVTSQRDTPVVLKSSDGGSIEMSVYQRGSVSPEVLGTEIKKLQTAFPARGDGFFNLLAERIVANGFSDQKLKDAVAKCIDTFSYKEINISDIIGYDKRVKLYTYGEMCDMIYNKLARCDDFKFVETKNGKYWIKKTERI